MALHTWKQTENVTKALLDPKTQTKQLNLPTWAQIHSLY